ncbi:hypothetical protein ACQVP2_22555 [Methylobacterium aquaticum]|uniref:hypothetical protein n=1 Tax=Methylobacterium aquaticum TaxID=270351 RepID=UPI003D163C94
MTPRMHELARHALGLPNAGRTSYRNRFYAVPGDEDWREWIAMTNAGLACVATSGPHDFFWLTQRCAEAALVGRERLCPEDFPNSPKCKRARRPA